MYLASIDDRMSMEILEGIETISSGILRHYGTSPFSLLCIVSSCKSQTSLWLVL